MKEDNKQTENERGGVVESSSEFLDHLFEHSVPDGSNGNIEHISFTGQVEDMPDWDLESLSNINIDLGKKLNYAIKSFSMFYFDNLLTMDPTEFTDNPSFKEMVSIHQALSSDYNKQGILPALLELMDGANQTHLLIPYIYLSGKIPTSYEDVHLAFIGEAKDLVDYFVSSAD